MSACPISALRWRWWRRARRRDVTFNACSGSDGPLFHSRAHVASKNGLLKPCTRSRACAGALTSSDSNKGG